MDPTAALLAGLVAGLVIAMQFGAVSLLLVEAAVAGGPRAGMAAGLGVATADIGFAAIAAAAGGGAGALLSAHEAEIEVVAAAVLAAIAAAGLLSHLRIRNRKSGADRPSEHSRAAGTHYARFLTITIANPLTIVSFAAVATALSLDGPVAASAFALGVGLASAAWHVALTLAAGHTRRWLTPRARRGLAVGGRLVVLALAAHLALGAF